MMLSNIMPFHLDIVTVVDNKNFNELKLLTILLQQLSYFSPNHIFLRHCSCDQHGIDHKSLDNFVHTE